MAVSEQQLDAYRQSGEKVRVVRDEIEGNDVFGVVVAWDDSTVMLRKPSRRVVKLSRSYYYMSAAQDRVIPDGQFPS
ncbi:hypothetical protein M6D81_12535 [Paenibacillus sp. J5C_2022]|uniref:hypothetical protein n=1 Tax=Paenibacillus sp. J5C2022 TaxID=2977129 RepID=UPI0021D28765|nr:hypothetical protein [Paenibacillus sp. J5C2022]MCU6709527.1 hypothetical protein [Paenibacillus sp. J5C2022]